MRVGIFVTPFDAGGQSFQMAVLAGLRELDCAHEFLVLTPGPSDVFGPGVDARSLSEFEPPNGKTTHLVNSLVRRFPTLGRLRHLIHQARGVQSVSLLDHAVSTYGLDLIWSISSALPDTRYPFIATVWDLQHRLQPFFPEVSYAGWTWTSRETAYRSALPRATRVITGTRTGHDEVVRFYGLADTTVRVIPFPVPTFVEQVAPTMDACQRLGLPARFLYYPAHFWPHKNHINLLKAFAILVQRGWDDLHLVFSGSDKGNKSYVESVAAAVGVKARIHFLGLVEQTDVVALYRQAVALVYPTFFGPDNLPPLEAFALGCPVVASRVSGAEEQLSDAALFFEPSDVEAMAAAIERVLDEPGLRDQLVSRGKARASRLTTRNYATAMVSILDELEPIRDCWGRNFVRAGD